MTPKRALVSVFDKTGILELCQFLHEHGVIIISTGGTAKILSDNDIPFIPVEQITGKPEAFSGRMKTISFEIASALLFRRDNEQDQQKALELNIEPIDLVVCNLYPFNDACKKNAPNAELIEMIDVGGPTMIRAAAKNYQFVSCLTNPKDYQSFMREWKSQQNISLRMRSFLAQKAFALLANYDLRIAIELNSRFELNPLRYGENPHQKVSVSPMDNSTQSENLSNANVLQGKALSYNNYIDIDQAYKCVSELYQVLPLLHHCVIVKHGNPCGIASHHDPLVALQLAWDCDPVSAFGGIIASSSEFSGEMAQWTQKYFIEAIIAPSFPESSKIVLESKKNVRLLECPLKALGAHEWSARSIHGAILWQEEDESMEINIKLATKKNIKESLQPLIPFALVCTKYLKSNALGLFGIKHDAFVIAASGVGQPNRLDCLRRLAVPKAIEAGWNLNDLLLVSDAFFPFDDIVRIAHQYGIFNILQPSGSINDQSIIATCDSLGVAMGFNFQRHFRH